MTKTKLGLTEQTLRVNLDDAVTLEQWRRLADTRDDVQFIPAVGNVRWWE